MDDEMTADEFDDLLAGGTPVELHVVTALGATWASRETLTRIAGRAHAVVPSTLKASTVSGDLVSL